MGIYCYECNKLTESIEPVVFEKVNNNFHICAKCKDCNATKRKFYSDYYKKFPEIFYNLKSRKPYIQDIDNIKIFPLIQHIINA